MEKAKVNLQLHSGCKINQNGEKINCCVQKSLNHATELKAIG
jgi:hypothetical protein